MILLSGGRTLCAIAFVFYKTIVMLTIIACLLIISGGGVAALLADLTNARQERQRRAKETYRLLHLRNGVTEPIPFAKPDAPINVPGLVEVHPRTQTPARIPTPKSPSNVPVGDVPPLESPPTQRRQPDDGDDGAQKISTAKAVPVRWNYPQGSFSVIEPSESALSVLRRLVADGERRKTALSWAVFGSNGGSVYNKAKPYIEDALSNAE